MMVTLHYLSNSRSFRVLWLLEELAWVYDVDYQLITHQRTQNYLAPDELKHIHPMGKAPILIDGEKVLAESGFILEYLLKKYDINHEFKPTDEDGWELFTFWLHFSESSMMPPLVMRLVMQKIVEKSPWLIKLITKTIAKKVEDLVIASNINQSFDLLESQLSKTTWVAGNKFSAADIQTYFSAKALDSRGGLGERNHIKQWILACEERLAYNSTTVKGGKLFDADDSQKSVK